MLQSVTSNNFLVVEVTVNDNVRAKDLLGATGATMGPCFVAAAWMIVLSMHNLLHYSSALEPAMVYMCQLMVLLPCLAYWMEIVELVSTTEVLYTAASVVSTQKGFC